MIANGAVEEARVRVLHILGPLRRSGAEMMFLQVLGSFASQGIQTIVATMDGSSQAEVAVEFARAGAEVHELSSPSKWRLLRDLHALLRAERPDCVHVHAERASLITTCLPALLRVRVIRSVHNSFGFDGFLRIRKRAERTLARVLGVRFVAVSLSVQENEATRFSNPSQLIMNWFDQVQFFPPTIAQRERARSLLGLESEIKVIAVVGNCSEVKNHALLLKALANMSEEERPLLLHVGDESSSPNEREFASELSLDDSVRYLGTVTDVASILHASDLFVMPSRYEGLGIAAIEALATGIPVVATDVPGLADLPRYSSAVTLVESTPSAMATEIRLQLAYPRDADRSKISGEINETFSSEQGVEQYVALYRGTIPA